MLVFVWLMAWLPGMKGCGQVIHLWVTLINVRIDGSVETPAYRPQLLDEQLVSLPSGWQTVDELFTHRCQNCTQVRWLGGGEQISADLRSKSKQRSNHAPDESFLLASWTLSLTLELHILSHLVYKLNIWTASLRAFRKICCQQLKGEENSLIMMACYFRPT